jgi:hypothetical protein
MQDTTITLKDFLESVRDIKSKWLDLLREVAPHVKKKYVIDFLAIPTDRVFDKMMKTDIGRGLDFQMAYFRTSFRHLVPKILLCSVGHLYTDGKTFETLAGVEFKVAANAKTIDKIRVTHKEKLHHAPGDSKLYMLAGILSTTAITEELFDDSSRLASQFFNIPGNLDKNVFGVMIESGQIKGKDLVSLCSSDKKVNRHCTDDLFRRLLFKEFGIREKVAQPREYYKRLHTKNEIIFANGDKFEATGILGIAQGGTTRNHGCFTHDRILIHDSPVEMLMSASPVAWFTEYYTDRRVIQMSCGMSHTLILYEDGTVDAIGSNTAGQLGIPRATARSDELVQVVFSEEEDVRITQLAAFGNSNSVLDTEGRVWKFGARLVPQIVSKSEGSRKVAQGNSCEAILDRNGNVHVVRFMYPEVPTFTVIPDLRNVRDIACGQGFVALITEDYKIEVRGMKFTQDGIVTKDFTREGTTYELRTKPVKITCGDQHVVVMDEDGDLWFLGDSGRRVVSGVFDWGKMVTRFRKIPWVSNVIDVTALDVGTMCLK